MLATIELEVELLVESLARPGPHQVENDQLAPRAQKRGTAVQHSSHVCLGQVVRALRDENGVEARRLREFVLEEVGAVKAEVRLRELPGSQRDTASIDVDSHVVELGEYGSDIARSATDLEDASLTGPNPLPSPLYLT
ncbi:MAG: hypothetical protein VCC04_16615 [Myxococcota bacterium]